MSERVRRQPDWESPVIGTWPSNARPTARSDARTAPRRASTISPSDLVEQVGLPSETSTVGGESVTVMSRTSESGT